MSSEPIEPEFAAPQPTASARSLVLKNTLLLTISQAATVPLSILANAVTARYLGPEVFGVAYLAVTLWSLGSLVVGWGHDGVLPAVIARDHATAGTMLGSSLAWRVLTFLPTYLVTAFVCHLFGYDLDLQWALLLTAVHQLIALLAAAFKDTIRGFERTDIPAYAHVGERLLATVAVIAALVLGGGLRTCLIVQILSGLVICFALAAKLPVDVGKPKFQWNAMKALSRAGTPFVVGGLVMTLQPNIDAIFLSKLAPADAVGWYAVARRIVGPLILPATALIGALYPTLCRLHATDRQAFTTTVTGSLRGVSLIVVPVTLGTALYADFAISLFSPEYFGPAAGNLQVMSLFVFLVFFSMTLGTAVLAAERSRAWSIVQSLCLVVSVVLDPLLIPWFQTHYGNGGLGLSVASVVSEVLIVVCGIALVPRGIFNRSFVSALVWALLAGCGMALVAWLTRNFTPFLGAPLAVAAYFTILWTTGGIERQEADWIRNFFGRRLAHLTGSSG